MEKKRLIDCIEILIDNRGKTPKHQEDGTYKILSANNVKSSGLIRLDEVAYANDIMYDVLMANKLVKNDIIITSEAPAGEVLLWDSDEKIVLGQRLYGLKIDKSIVNPIYLAYYLKSYIGQNEIIKNCTGSTVLGISKKTFDNIWVYIPDKKTQEKIGNVLLSIDRQIVRNNEMVQKLQDMAQTTYSRWFNQFEFPNNEGKPYKSDGGKLVYNKELGREIPIDWEVKTLGDLIKKVTPSFNYSSNLPTIDLSVMPFSSFMLNELNESKNFTSNLFAMEKGNILFGSIRPYLKKAGIAPCNGVVTGTVHQYKEIEKDFYNFALMTMVQDSFFDYALQVATGTKMPVVSSDNLLNYKVPFNKEAIKKFQDSFNLVDITCNCVMQNQELNKLKERLLPLLINGQLNI